MLILQRWTKMLRLHGVFSRGNSFIQPSLTFIVNLFPLEVFQWWSSGYDVGFAYFCYWMYNPEFLIQNITSCCGLILHMLMNLLCKSTRRWLVYTRFLIWSHFVMIVQIWHHLVKINRACASLSHFIASLETVMFTSQPHQRVSRRSRSLSPVRAPRHVVPRRNRSLGRKPVPVGAKRS